MSNLNEKLADFSIEKLEERKEFTFYCNPNPCGSSTSTGTGGNTGASTGL